MVVDEHLVLRAGHRELFEEVRDLCVGAIHEVYLEALRAELREVLCDLLLLAVHLGPRHPQDDADALLVGVVDEVGNVDLRAVLPDVELRAPALVEDHVFNAGLRGEIDEAHIRLGRAALGIALVVEGVPPVPRDLAGLNPGEVGALRGRRRKRIEDVRLAELGRRVSERKGAPGKCARQVGLGNKILRLLDPHPAAALLKPGFLAPAADALRSLRILREKRLELRAALGLLDVAEVPDRIVVDIGVHNSDRLPLCGIDEREVDRLFVVCLEGGCIGKLGNRLLAAERAATGAIEPAASALGDSQIGLLAVDYARLLRLEAIGNAVVARGEPHAPVAEVDESLAGGKAHLPLLVHWEIGGAAGLLRSDVDRLRAAFLDALAVHIEPDLGLGDNDNSITHDFVGKGI